MNLLELMPTLKEIIEKNVHSKEDKRLLLNDLKEINISKDINNLLSENSLYNSKTILDNKHWFVSGAIPALLWCLVIVTGFNYIFSPLLQSICGIVIPLISLPESYYSMCLTVILALLAKKSWDGSSFNIGDKFSKRSKYETTSTVDNERSKVVTDIISSVINNIRDYKVDSDNICNKDNEEINNDSFLKTLNNNENNTNKKKDIKVDSSNYDNMLKKFDL